MAFVNKIGSLLKRAVPSNTTNPSMLQAIRSMSSSELFSRGVSYNTDDMSRKEAFDCHGEVIEARIIMDRETGRSRGFAFNLAEKASAALAAMDGKENLLHMRRKILSSSKMTFPFSMSGNKFTFRGIATTSPSEQPSSQDTSADSSDPVAPQRIKFKRPDKTARNIMNILNKEALEEAQVNREFPDIKPGYIIQLKVEVPENKRRLSALKGIVIAISKAGVHSTFRLRRLVAGVGVESVFPLYSPNIKEMKVLDKKQVRRAKLYYLRDRMNPLKNK